MIKLSIGNQKVTVKEGTTILKAAEKLGIEIPTLMSVGGVRLTKGFETYLPLIRYLRQKR